MRALLSITAFLVLLTASSAFAQNAERERPRALQRLVDCRALPAAEERLACLEREVEAIDAAEASKELVILDRPQIRKTQRSLFGLALPDLGIFGDDQDKEGEQAKLETTIVSATQNAQSKWVLRLADGARWVQTDGRQLSRDPKAGDPIVIKRAFLGSYLANIRGQTAIRVKRIS
jgi:hypothetical protein